MRRIIATVLAVTGFVLAGATPAAADTPYYFYVGDPTYYTYPGTALGATFGHCTGGYAIAGTDGTFILGAGCSLISAPVRGRDREFADARYRNATTDLVSERAPDDAFQIVRDPLTGASPGGAWIQGIMPTSDQRLGTLVGKMGDGSGWTEGRITGWIDWRGEQAICTDAPTAPGDAGGPVWRSDGYGLRALGIIVAYDPGSGGGCYLPIQQILNDWGAWLPAYGRNAYPDGMSVLDPSLPQLDAAPYGVPADYQPQY